MTQCDAYFRTGDGAQWQCVRRRHRWGQHADATGRRFGHRWRRRAR